jgi:hypothetical protein
MKDVYFVGHTVGTIVKKDNWKECADHCNNEATCYAWSYFPQQYADLHKQCEMKGASFKNGQIKLTGVTSGIKGCNKNNYTIITSGICASSVSKDHCKRIAKKEYNVDTITEIEESEKKYPSGCYYRAETTTMVYNTDKDNTAPDCTLERICFCEKTFEQKTTMTPSTTATRTGNLLLFR